MQAQATALTPATPETPPLPVCRFTVEDNHRMIQAAVLTQDDRVELLEGWLTVKMVRNPDHDVAIAHADEAFRPLLPQGWNLRIQSAITTDDSELEPDLAVVRGKIRSYKRRHPAPQEIALVVDVAESTLDRDREVKGPLYARSIWICMVANSTPFLAVLKPR